MCTQWNALQLKKKTHIHRSSSSKTSLGAQWWGVHLPTQETRVRALMQEDPTSWGATKLKCHSCWAHELQLLKPKHHNAHALQPKPRRWEAHTRKACTASRGQQSQKQNNLLKRRKQTCRSELIWKKQQSRGKECMAKSNLSIYEYAFSYT